MSIVGFSSFWNDGVCNEGQKTLQSIDLTSIDNQALSRGTRLILMAE